MSSREKPAVPQRTQPEELTFRGFRFEYSLVPVLGGGGCQGVESGGQGTHGGCQEPGDQQPPDAVGQFMDDEVREDMELRRVCGEGRRIVLVEDVEKNAREEEDDDEGKSSARIR